MEVLDWVSSNVDSLWSNWFPFCAASESDPCIFVTALVYIVVIVYGNNCNPVSSLTEILITLKLNFFQHHPPNLRVSHNVEARVK